MLADKPKGTITNISELVKALSNDFRASREEIWYRGHADIKWLLVPSIFRNRKTTENKLLKEFQKDATLLVDNRPTHEYEWLFIMRHYFVPSRLLDWTENPLIALYFAVNHEAKKKNLDGALWILKPRALNRQQELTLQDPTTLPSFAQDDALGAYTPESYYKSGNVNSKPLAIIAPRNTYRMRAQQSVFTISVNDSEIDKIGKKNYAWYYKIPKESKKIILKELEMLGIKKEVLFPELETIGKRVRDLVK